MNRVVSHFVVLCAILAGSVTTAFGDSSPDACNLIGVGEITKATGLTVGNGKPGTPIPGVLGRCTWQGSGSTRIVLTLADTQHMQRTIEAQQASGGSPETGLGSKAVGIKGAAFTGGGYIVSVVDGKGGFGVSILGTEGTRERVLALAKLVESHRH
jgi:hypothetical protein